MTDCPGPTPVNELPNWSTHHTVSTAQAISGHQLTTCENFGTSGIRTHAVNEPTFHHRQSHYMCDALDRSAIVPCALVELMNQSLLPQNSHVYYILVMTLIHQWGSNRVTADTKSPERGTESINWDVLCFGLSIRISVGTVSSLALNHHHIP